MTTATLDPVATPSRFQVLPSAVRIVRLGPGDHGWLVEYEKILRIAAADFLRRGQVPGTVAGVLRTLGASLAVPSRGVWFVLTPQYQFLGFAIVEVCAPLFDGPVRAVVLAMYLYARRTPRSVFAALRATIIDWARAQGAQEMAWLTHRRTPRVWRTIGQPHGTFYIFPIPEPGKE